jgi:hypothetical protein
MMTSGHGVYSKTKGEEMKPLRFFTLQLLCVLGWLVTLGAVGFVIFQEKDYMFVIQGWTDLMVETEL